jgi:hypothetical protein
MAKSCGGPVRSPATSGISVAIDFEPPPGKLDLIFDPLAEYGAIIFDRHERRFTLTFEESEDADDFLRELLGRGVRLQDYLA